MLLKVEYIMEQKKTELLLLKDNDATETNVADKIRLRADNIAFDTYSTTTTTDRTTENIKMIENVSGDVGIEWHQVVN